MNTKIEGIYQTLSNLVSLQYDNTSILNLKKYKIAKDIIEGKPNLQELIIKNNGCQNGNVAVSIADGLMEARKLQLLIFRNNNNKFLEGSICKIMNNLPWSPNLKVVDFSKSKINEDQFETFNKNLFKLLSMSRTIEYFNISHVGNVFDNFKHDTFKALAQNHSLKYLDMSYTSTVRDECDIKRFAHSIAINSEDPKGKLEELILNGFFANQDQFYKLIERLWVTEQLKEKWFGDEEVAKTMSLDTKVRNYTCRIKTLSINKCKFTENSKWSKEQIKNYENGIELPVSRFVRFLGIFQNLEKLGMNHCGNLPWDQMMASIKGGIHREEKRDIINEKMGNKLKYWDLSNDSTISNDDFSTHKIHEVLAYFKDLEAVDFDTRDITAAVAYKIRKWLE